MGKYGKLERKDNFLRPRDNFGIVLFLFAILMVIFLYWRWALPGVITWGDWWYNPKSALSDLSLTLWMSASGFGQEPIALGPLLPLVVLHGFLYRVFHWDPSIMQRIVFFMPLVLFLILSPWYLARTLRFGWRGIAATIIVFNLNSPTFLIAVIPTIALAAAFGPFVIARFIKLVRYPRLRESIIFGLVVAFQIVYEVRIAYVSILFCGLYLLYSIMIDPKVRCALIRISKMLLLSIMVVFLFHSYWIIQLLFEKMSGALIPLLPKGYSAVGWVRALSYATLLHNLGMQSFHWGSGLNPRFLLLPIVAFSVFLFCKRNRIILFFGLSVLIFSFLGKGSKPPFGELYIWLFLHFPGFSMFRVPGKWSGPLILSYAVLVGYFVEHLVSRQSVSQLNRWLVQRLNYSSRIIKIGLIVISIVIFLIVFPVQPLSTLSYSGIFDPRPVPEESNYLEGFLHSQSEFFRVLWLPGAYRFGYSSSQHPALQGVADLDRGLLSALRSGYRKRDTYVCSSYLGRPFSLQILRLFSVKYLLVPFAPQDDFIYYWYDMVPEYYNRLCEITPGLQYTHFKGKSRLYEVPNYLPHLYVSSISHLIAGNYYDILPIVARSDYLNTKKPFLIITEQNSKLNSSLLSSENLILQDRSFKDLGVEFTGFFKIPFQISKNEYKQRLKIKIQKTGAYEIWIDCSKIPMENGRGIIFVVSIDEQIIYEADISLAKKRQKEYVKYLKLGELNLTAGNHRMEINLKDAEFRQPPYSLTLILTEKKDRIGKENVIVEELNQPDKNISYIFTDNATFYIQ